MTGVTIAEGAPIRASTEIQTLAQKAGKTVKRAPPAMFKQLFGEAVHQGVYVDVQPLRAWHEEELDRRRSRRSSKPSRQRRRSCWCSTACRILTTSAPACAPRTPAVRSRW